jgi:hypothetical protein
MIADWLQFFSALATPWQQDPGQSVLNPRGFSMARRDLNNGLLLKRAIFGANWPKIRGFQGV